MRKGCSSFLTHVRDTRTKDTDCENIAVLNEYMDIFPKKLLGLPLEREL